jgi:hypothetical protein
MIVHSDSFLGVMFLFLVMLGASAGPLTSIVLLIALKYRAASKIFLSTAGGLALFFVLQGSMLALTPRAVITRGDSFCADIWCIGVKDVKTSSLGEDMRLLLVDEQGRRFPLVPDPSVPPFNKELAPREGFDTTLTFNIPSGSGHLYLTSEPTKARAFVVRLFTGDWLGEHFASLRKPFLLQVS